MADMASTVSFKHEKTRVGNDWPQPLINNINDMSQINHHITMNTDYAIYRGGAQFQSTRVMMNCITDPMKQENISQ